MSVYLFRKTVFNCRKATLLSLKKQDGSASAWERTQLFYHNLYCQACRQFARQSKQLNKILGDLDGFEFETPTHAMPDSVKSSLQAQLDEFKK